MTRRVHEFAVEPARLWAAITSTGRYQAWWPWLREFDGSEFDHGSTWSCTIRSPLLYSVRFRVSLDHVDAPSGVAATVSGDIEGHANIAIEAVPGGSALWLTSHLAPVRPLLRHLSRVAPRVTRWGHDRVIRTGLRRFGRHAFDDRGSPDR
ncbi:hypothetical protein BH23ACT3_BH23ACT3_22900 [soil metagenome]